MLDREALRRELDSLSLARAPEPPPPARRGSGALIVTLLTLALLAAGGWSGWRWWNGRGVEVGVGFATAGGASGPATILSMGGYVAARKKATVGAVVSGRLVELNVDEGDMVKEGQVIARIESDVLEARKLEAAALLEEARLKQERFERLEKQGIVSKWDLDQAIALYQSRSRNVEALQKEIDLTIIRAPIDGRVLRRDAEPGEIVSTGGFGLTKTAIVTLADPKDLEVEVDVNEVDLARVPIGAPARIYLDGWPDAPYPGRVNEIAPTANRQKATVQVKVLVFQPDERIRPEMSARVVLLDAEEGKPPATDARRVLVPRDAVREGGAAVFVVEDGVARRRAVKTGGTEGDRVVVLEGLAGNETMVTGEAPGLRDGGRVRVRSR